MRRANLRVGERLLLDIAREERCIGREESWPVALYV